MTLTNNFAKTAFVAALGLFLSTGLYAQTTQDGTSTTKKEKRGRAGDGEGRGPMDPASRSKADTQRMTETLGLNADQAKAVEAINTKYAAKQNELMTALRPQDGSRPSEEARTKGFEQMKALNDAKDAELKKVLTADQYTKYAATRKDGRGGPGGRFGGGRPDGDR